MLSLAFVLCAGSLDSNSSAHRQLASPGCDACCFRHDCRLAFSSTQPGICCGTYPHSGCCPYGSKCVQCGSTWRCTRSHYVSRGTRASVCRATGYAPGGYHSPHYSPYIHNNGGPAYGYHPYHEQEGDILSAPPVLSVACLGVIFLVAVVRIGVMLPSTLL